MPYAVIGDLVASRTHADQVRLIEAAGRQYAWVNERTSPGQPLTPTVGDEFQAVYRTIEEALVATLLLSLALKVDPGIDSRFGIGEGTVSVTAAASPPYAQSGTAWWEARAALDEVADGKRSSPRTLRSAYRGEGAPLVNGLLVLRDELLAEMDERDAKITLGLFESKRQQDLAADLGISQPAVSQRLHRGPLAVYHAHDAMVAP